MAPIQETQAPLAGPEERQRHDQAGETQQPNSPVHPIPQLQGAFGESILETVEKTENKWVVDLDAQSRRRDLLENVEYERLCGRRWRQRPGERYHPFWKLVAQMSFGVHLLARGLARSDAEVLKILQSHVDELDGFLERTSEDFLITQLDLRTRIQYLSLPLQNLDVFDGMLADRSFRLSMINYNDLIERAIDRFSIAVKDALKDIHKGKEAMGAFWHYIKQSVGENTPVPDNLQDIYDAMTANVEGWNMTFSRLRKKGTALESALGQLGLTVTEMQRRVGVASRKDRVRSKASSAYRRPRASAISSNIRQVSFMNPSQSPPRSRSLKKRLFEKGPSIASRPVSEKPLPRAPGLPEREGTPAISQRAGSRRMTQKSVPNLRTTKASDRDSAVTSTPGRARSANGAADTHAGPRTQRSLTRKLSNTVLPRRSTSENYETTQVRPAAESSRALKSRSVSLDQLKALRGNRKTPAPGTPSVPQIPAPLQPSTRQETMKDQILHHFKTDRVADAWETAEKKKKKEEKRVSRRSSLRKMDGPLSIFRARSSNGLRNSERPQTASFENDLGMQISRLQQEAETLNTYSFKPKCDVSPRIHVLSVHSTLAEEEEEQEQEQEANDDDTIEIESTGGDAESLITALPSVPLPPITEIPTNSRTSSLSS